MQEVEVKNREDVSKLNYFTKKFITHVYRSFALSKFNNFEDNFHEFSIGFQDTTDQSLVGLFNFGHQSNWGYHELEEMKNLSAKDHEKLCEKGLENFSIVLKAVAFLNFDVSGICKSASIGLILLLSLITLIFLVSLSAKRVSNISSIVHVNSPPML